MGPNSNTRPRINTAYAGLLALATVWAVVNCLYVYLGLAGDKAYRLESAVIVLVLVALPAIVFRGWSGERPTDADSPMRHALIALAAIWLLIALPLLTLPFLSDDYGFLGLYRSIGDAMRPFQFYRPGFAVAFAVIARAAGGSPVLFHVTSFLLHLGSAMLVYSLARKLLGSVEAAVVAFAVFLLSPIQLESVLWISGLQELLWTFFVLAALRCYVGGRERQPWRVAAVLALSACGLASKETAVCVVLLLPAADLFFFKFKRGPMQWLTYSGLAVELAAYLAIRRRMVPVDDAFFVRPSHYFVKQFLAMPYEIFMHPWNLSAMHVPMLVFCASALVGLGLLVAAVWKGAGVRVFAGPAIVAISTLPVYSLFYVSPELAGSRYLYFATAGFALLLADLLTTVVTSRMPRLACLVAIAVTSAVSLDMNARPWRTAGVFIESLHDGLQKGIPAAEITRGWQAHGAAAGLSVRDGVPQEFEGVAVLKNGYPEFVELTKAK